MVLENPPNSNLEPGIKGKGEGSFPVHAQPPFLPKEYIDCSAAETPLTLVQKDDLMELQQIIDNKDNMEDYGSGAPLKKVETAQGAPRCAHGFMPRPKGPLPLPEQSRGESSRAGGMGWTEGRRG